MGAAARRSGEDREEAVEGVDAWLRFLRAVRANQRARGIDERALGVDDDQRGPGPSVHPLV